MYNPWGEYDCRGKQATASDCSHPPDMGPLSQSAKQIVVLTSDSVLVSAVIRMFPMHTLSNCTLQYSAKLKVGKSRYGDSVGKRSDIFFKVLLRGHFRSGGRGCFLKKKYIFWP